MAALDRSLVREGVTIRKNNNTAYDLRKEGEEGERLEDDYEIMHSPSGGLLTENMTYTPSLYSSHIPPSQLYHALWPHPLQVMEVCQWRQKECMRVFHVISNIHTLRLM